MTLTRRTWLLVPVLAALAACASAPSAPTSTASAAPSTPGPVASVFQAKKPPRLVVFMVVDGLPIRQVLGYRDQLQPDGFQRFLDRGAWFANAYYGHGYTVTAAGHSIMLSGAYPQRSGIIGNEWRDPMTAAPQYNTADPRYQYIGNKTEPLAGTSPNNYKVETVGDVLRTLQPGSKVIGISGKDRGAILPAGHKGTAYMYMGGSGEFASSTYYMDKHPAWVDAFNAAKPADKFFGKTWSPRLPEAAYARSVPDGQPWQANSGNGNRLPAVLGAGMDGPGPRFYGNILPSPFGDELTLAFAKAAVEGERLGADDQTDILSVSLSSHDYINHAFGPESRLSHDHFLHLDAYLQDWFKYLDAKVGRDNYVAVLTADHGFTDTPEWAKSQGRDAGRINPAQVVGVINAGLSKRFGEFRWALNMSGSGVIFDEVAIKMGASTRTTSTRRPRHRSNRSTASRRRSPARSWRAWTPRRPTSSSSAAPGTRASPPPAGGAEGRLDVRLPRDRHHPRQPLRERHPRPAADLGPGMGRPRPHRAARRDRRPRADAVGPAPHPRAEAGAGPVAAAARQVAPTSPRRRPPERGFPRSPHPPATGAGVGCVRHTAPVGSAVSQK
ncbi:alkaline phosphatase family protein [Roseateles chitinivorans]|uniref:alkaline phosphatase family protein n=1 Tax=Roseateles chitinivorans TaxID=2917965 RepID=UPI003D67FA6A